MGRLNEKLRCVQELPAVEAQTVLMLERDNGDWEGGGERIFSRP